jgi:hypothetical protein
MGEACGGGGVFKFSLQRSIEKGRGQCVSGSYTNCQSVGVEIVHLLMCSSILLCTPNILIKSVHKSASPPKKREVQIRRNLYFSMILSGMSCQFSSIKRLLPIFSFPQIWNAENDRKCIPSRKIYSKQLNS